jgi:3-phenylpropionate/trans-cinnamate dioxygenase ferredoxin reductase subunit
MDNFNYIIIGGGMAGGKATEGIRKIDTDGTVALVTEEPHNPYERPPLSKGYLQGKSKLNKVFLHKEDYYTENNIQVLTSSRVTRIQPNNHTITLKNGQEMAYGKLLLATGGHAWRLPIEGNQLPGVFTLRSIENSDAIRQMAEAGQPALVLGGSFIGAEAAASLNILGMNVTMVFPESRLLERVVPAELSEFLHHIYEKRGVRILTGTTPGKLDGEGKVERAQLSNNEILDAKLVVMGVGIRLNTELARDASLSLTDTGAVIVDNMLRTSNPDIYAAGDIAAWPDPTFEKRLRVEHWDVARTQGLQAGRNMAGQNKAYTVLPYFFSDLFDFSFEAWGDLSSWDRTALQGSLETDHFTYYYFLDGRITGVLSVNPSDEVRDMIPHLIKERLSYDAVIEKLGNV